MTTVTTQSPMNLMHVNDTDAGIDVPGRTGLDTAPTLLSGLEPRRGRPPGI